MADTINRDDAEPASAQALALALGLSDFQADALLSLGRLLAAEAAQELGAALAQPVRIAEPMVASVALGALDSQDWDGLTIDVRLVASGQAHPAVLILPQAEIQALLPATGSADLPNLQALSDVLGGLTNRLSQAQGALRISLSEADVETVTAQGQDHLRLYHTVKIGDQPPFVVTHLLPVAALQEATEWIAAHGLQTTEATTAAGPAAPQPPPGAGRTPAARPAREVSREARPAMPSGGGVYPAQFSPLEVDGEVKGGTNLELLLDVPLRVSVEIGRTERTLKDVLELGPNSVIPLDKLNGEPMDIYVNDRRIARGEVVVLPDEKFAVRVTEIINPAALIRAAHG